MTFFHRKEKVVIGLTGGLGSGKSTALAEFKRLGAVTSDADALVHSFLAPGGKAYGKVVRLFGPEVVREDRALDRKAVAARVFRSPALRRKLEGILHPLVRREMARVVSRTRRGLVVLDIPLLFESRLRGTVDRACVVWAPEAVRYARLMKSGRFTRRDIRARMRAQIPLVEKRRRADDVIDNGGSLARTRTQVRSIYNRFTTP